MKSNWKLALFCFVLAFFFRCAATQDCSAFPVTSYKRCSCIAGNGDAQRARQCNREFTNKMLERAKRECLRKCWEDDCNEKCDNL